MERYRITKLKDQNASNILQNFVQKDDEANQSNIHDAIHDLSLQNFVAHRDKVNLSNLTYKDLDKQLHNWVLE